MIKSADKILLIHDGKSQGTTNELKRTKKFKKPYRYEVIEPTDTYLQRTKDDKLDAWQPDNSLDMQLDLNFDIDLQPDEEVTEI